MLRHVITNQELKLNIFIWPAFNNLNSSDPLLFIILIFRAPKMAAITKNIVKNL